MAAARCHLPVLVVPGRTIQPTDFLEPCSGDLGSTGCLLEHYFDYCSAGDGLRLGLADHSICVHLTSASAFACAATWMHNDANWPYGYVQIHDAEDCSSFLGGEFWAQLSAASLTLLFDDCSGSPHTLLRPARCALQAATCLNERQTRLKDLYFTSLWAGDPVGMCEGFSVGCIVAIAHHIASGAVIAGHNSLNEGNLLECLRAFNDNFQYWFHTDGRQLCQISIGDPVGVDLCKFNPQTCPVPC